MSNGDPGKLLDNDGRRGEDMRLIRRALRWKMSKEKAEKLLDHVMDLGLASDVARDAAAAAKTVIAAEAQNQADEHLDEKNKRLDEGKPTESVGVRVFKVEFDE